jgi:hypothetical protein
MSQEAKRTLIYAILKFLRDELKQENINADLKESLEVASQCLESSYEIAIDDEICKNNFDSGLDLLAIAEKSVVKVFKSFLISIFNFFFFFFFLKSLINSINETDFDFFVF